MPGTQHDRTVGLESILVLSWDLLNCTVGPKTFPNLELVSFPSILPLLDPSRGWRPHLSMPFARVGAMPQPPSNKQRNNQRHGGRGSTRPQKGITMEDLKKQTALRLAQEQRQNPFPEPEDRPFRPPLSEHQLQQGYGRSNYPLPGHVDDQNVYQQRGAQEGLNVQYHHGAQQNPNTFHQSYPSPIHSNRLHHTSSYEIHATSTAPPIQYNNNVHPSPRNVRPDHNQVQQVAVSKTSPHSPVNIYRQERRPAYNPPGASDIDQALQAKQKLPHGLTVHELKAMTHARLQAEAAGKSEGDNARFSPLDFDSARDIPDRPVSQESAGRANHHVLHHGTSSDSMGSIPSLVQVNQNSRDINSGRQPQTSPLPPGLQNLGSTHSLHSQPDSSLNRHSGGTLVRDSRQISSRSDGWDAGSVTSHNSTVVSDQSTYSMGYSSGMNLPENDFNGSQFNRTRSYTTGHMPASGFDNRVEESTYPHSAYASPGSSFAFDTAVGGNRCRAATMSPRPKPGSIREDYPHYEGEVFGIPNFSSAPGAPLAARKRESYSPVLQLGLDNSIFGQNLGFSSGSDALNRPRTSSTASFPPASHQFEDVNRVRANTFSGFSMDQKNRSRDQYSDPLHEGLLGFSLSNVRDEPDPKYSSSNAFRGATDSRVGAPPGFLAARDSRTLHPAGSYGNFTSSPSPGPNTSIFGPSDVEDLTDSVSSVLKLSGATDRPDRERFNTYPNSASDAANAYFTDQFLFKDP